MRKEKNKTKYVAHICKNEECCEIWIAEDQTNAQTYPPKWAYCKNCCKNYGYVNPEVPPKKVLSNQQKEVLEKNNFKNKEKNYETK